MGAGVVSKITVVCPTEHLKTQWADAAARVGIHIDPAFSNSQGRAGSHFDGVAVTYAQVAANPHVHASRTRAFRTLVILDEIHHAGDALSWGDGIGVAFGEATRRLSLTGTPFRSDSSPIPFVRYVEGSDGIRRSHSTKDIMKQAWRTALDPKGEWISAVLQAADQRLSQVRRAIPDAGGLVIASDQSAARAYAQRLRAITGKPATVVLSDDADASDRIDHFRESTDRWMVAVRMVSEGVDVPRLSVGVYATNTSTSLFFAQAVGRFVRARRRGETSTVFIPSVVPLLDLAGQMEVERDHALDKPHHGPDDPTVMDTSAEDLLMAQANKVENASSELTGTFEALGGDAEFDAVLFEGSSWGSGAEVGSIEEQEYLGIPGLLDADQVTTLLKARQAEQIKTQRRQSDAKNLRDANAGISDHRARAAKRKELSRLVGQWSRRSGDSHALIHSQLRQRCGGPEVARATTAQIDARIALLRGWFVGRA